RFDGLTLLENQQGQNAVGDDEQNHQQRQHDRWPRRRFKSCYALSAANDSQSSPPARPIHSDLTKEHCTRETIRKGKCKCVLRTELLGGDGIGPSPRMQASALYE